MLHKPNFTLLLMMLMAVLVSCKKEFQNNATSVSDLKFITGGIEDKIATVKATRDGGFIFCGYTKNTGASIDGFLLKTDASGNKEWYRTYGGVLRDNFFDVLETMDGGFLAVGQTNSIGKGTWDTTSFLYDYVVMTDANGTMQWEKSYIGELYTSRSYAISAVESTRGVFTVVGATDYNGLLYTTFFQIKSDGRYTYDSITPYRYTIFNPKVYPPNKIQKYYNAWPVSVYKGAPGHVLIGGLMSYSNIPGETNELTNFIIDLNQLKNSPTINFYQPYYEYRRNALHEYRIWDPDRDAPMIIKTLPDGLLYATHTEMQRGKVAMELVKTTSYGDVLWERQYPCLGYSVLSDMIVDPDGSIILAGASSSEPVSFDYKELFRNLKLTLVKVDANGDELWKSYIGGNENVLMAQAIVRNQTGGYNLAARYTDSESGFDMMLTLQTNDKGQLIKP